MISFLDIFIKEQDPNRVYVVALQTVPLFISILYLFISYFSRTSSKIHNSLLVFVLMLIGYALFSPQLYKLPVILYGLMFLFPAYYLSIKGTITDRHIIVFAIIMLMISFYQTYLGIYERADKLGDFFKRADNIGYRSLMVMFLFSLNIKKARDVVFLFIAYLLVVLSFKRGAMLAGTVVLFINLIPLLRGKLGMSKNDKVLLYLSSFIMLLASTTLLIYFWDIVAYRFIHDETGGSGRDLFWSEIVRGWKNAPIINKIFGSGFFAVPGLLGSYDSFYGGAIYAHSDWYELLYDHGIFGLVVYGIFVAKILFQSKRVKKYAQDYYYAYLSVCAAWLMVSYYSGIYTTKSSIFYMLIIGFVLATVDRNKRALYFEKSKIENNCS